MILANHMPGVFRLLESMTHIDDRFLAEVDELDPQELATFVTRYRQTMDRYKRTLAFAGACLSVATVAVLWMQRQRRATV